MLNRHVLNLALVAGLSALFLGGCGSGGDSGGGGGAKTYTIGFQAGLSGGNGQFGINEANGVELAVEKFNSSPEAPFQVRLVKSDDGGSEAQAPAAAQRLIGDGDVVAVIGPAFSDTARASGQLYAAAKLAAVSPSATSPGLTDPGNGFASLLRGVPGDVAQGSGIASYLRELGLRKVLVVDDGTEYGVGLGDVVRHESGRAGVQVVSESVPKGTPDYGPAAARVRDSGAEGLVYAGYYRDAALLARELKEAGVAIPVIAGDGTKDARFVESAGDAAENWFVACPCADAGAEPSMKEFSADYRAKFKMDPGAYSAEAYDVANMVVEEIGKLDAAGSEVTREAVLGSLRKATYRGLTRTFAFDEKGDFVGEDVYLYQVTAGRIAYLGRVDELVSR